MAGGQAAFSLPAFVGQVRDCSKYRLALPLFLPRILCRTRLPPTVAHAFEHTGTEPAPCAHKSWDCVEGCDRVTSTVFIRLSFPWLKLIHPKSIFQGTELNPPPPHLLFH